MNVHTQVAWLVTGTVWTLGVPSPSPEKDYAAEVALSAADNEVSVKEGKICSERNVAFH